MKRYNDGPRVHFIVKDLVNPFRFQSIYTILQAYKPVYESLNVILQGGGGESNQILLRSRDTVLLCMLASTIGGELVIEVNAQHSWPRDLYLCC